MSERKYRQRGYQESDERERATRERPASRATPDGPRGRGLGGPSRRVFRCSSCGREQEAARAMAFDSKCTECGADLHSCTHCSHFDPAAFRQCTQPVPERIPVKDRANRCDLFSPRWRQETSGSEPGGDPSRGKDPRAAFDALFKF